MMKACPFCAEEIQDAAIVCKHCGRDLPTVIAEPARAATPPIQRIGSIGRLAMVVAVFVGVFVLVVTVIILGTPDTSHSPAPRSPDSAPGLDAKDWHHAGDGMEVRWVNDDIFSHVGGHCYGRKTDGSTRTADGKAGLIDVGEKYCILFDAKDTPFEVPDKR